MLTDGQILFVYLGAITTAFTAAWFLIRRAVIKEGFKNPSDGYKERKHVEPENK